MTPPASPAIRPEAPPAGRWALTAMLSVFMAVNFADKAAFGLAALPIMREMHLTPSAYGLLGASFFALFSLAAVVIGRLGDRISTKWLLAGMSLVWTAAQLPLFAPVSLAAFFGLRILLGAGEGAAFPTALHAAYKWFPDRERPLATAIVEIGIPLGSALAAFGVTRIIGLAGWHVALGTLGFASFLWCCGWLIVDRASPASQAAHRPAGRLPLLPPRALLLNRTMIGVTVAGFATYWVSAISVIWLPAFLHVAVGLRPAIVGNVLTVAWLLQVPLLPLTGACAAYLGTRAGSGVARTAFAAAGLGVSGTAMLLLSATTSVPVSVVLATLCLCSTIVALTVLPPIVAEIAPAGYRSTALGACLAFASLGGVVAPAVFGRAVDLLAHGAAGYRLAMLISGGSVLVGAVAGLALIRPRADAERLSRLSGSATSLPAS